MKKRILVADDSTAFRSLEEAMLKLRGYEVLSAADGAEALRIAIQETPDLILLDIQMPVMDGVQVLAALQRDERTKAIPVIVITTIGRARDREILLQGGASDFVSKPIDGPTLVGKVRDLIGE